jgi:hypothetical protein
VYTAVVLAEMRWEGGFRDDVIDRHKRVISVRPIRQETNCKEGATEAYNSVSIAFKSTR